MAKQTGEVIDMLAGLLAASRQVSFTRLNRELVQLIQSTEILAATSSLSREQAD